MSKSKITHEDEETLKKELPKVLEGNGANNISKAKYVKMISEYVIGSDKPKFFSMQPQIKDRNQLEQWKAAYLIVFNYLDEFQDSMTKEVMLKELAQNKIQKPGLPSIPSGYSTNDINEVFSMETLFEVANNSDFGERVEDFVANYLHEDIQKPAAKPLGQSPGNSPAAFLTQPNTQHAQNANVSSKADDVKEDDDIIDIEDFNDDYDKEDDNQPKTEEKGSKKDEEEQEIIDIENLTDSEGEDQKEGHEDNVENEVDEFKDDEDFIDDVDDIEDENVDKENDKSDIKENKTESDAQNSNMSISINSDMFEVDFDDS